MNPPNIDFSDMEVILLENNVERDGPLKAQLRHSGYTTRRESDVEAQYNMRAEDSDLPLVVVLEPENISVAYNMSKHGVATKHIMLMVGGTPQEKEYFEELREHQQSFRTFSNYDELKGYVKRHQLALDCLSVRKNNISRSHELPEGHYNHEVPLPRKASHGQELALEAVF